MHKHNLLPLPEPEFGEQRAFKQRSQADVSYRTRRARPPKLTQKQHDFSYNRSQNSSIPHAISFKQSNNRSAPSSIENDVSLVNSIYRPSSPESYFDQCFEVLERLGEGSFGEVFKVRSKEDGRLYAIKKSLKLYRSQVSRQERIEEVKRYEQFSGHENCITLHKAWEQNDLLYMQLELCKSNLEAYVMNRSDFLSEIEIWDILIDLLLAVKALHDQNLIHLDIKSENIMVSEDNVCKLGDFGLVTDLQKLNFKDATEGDCRYIAPEILQNKFSKAADIFSLGITILELACKLELPHNGYLWHVLRSGILPENYLPHLSSELRDIIKAMLHPQPQLRPDVNTLLKNPRIHKLIIQRRLNMPLRKIKKATRYTVNKLRLIKSYICNMVMSIVSMFKLKHLKNPTPPIALTSTPTVSSFICKPTEDSFMRLEDSKIDFEDSPNRSQNKSFGNLSPMMMNSTPLNHYNNHGSFRRGRKEVSRTSLVFDDCDIMYPNANGSMHGAATPIKRKKLFDSSDSD